MSDARTFARARLGTRATFFCAGFALACWAPLVPYAKARAGIDDAALGLLLLCLGAGSIATMPLSGAFVARAGSKVPILTGLAGLCLTLPALAAAGSFAPLAAALLLFGASLGLLDVAMNVEAVAVERGSGGTLMSGFHGLFSVGGLTGAGSTTALLSAGLLPVAATGIAVLLVLILGAVAAPRLLDAGSGAGAMFAVPRGVVVLLGVLAFVAFLIEGAMLDWGAVLLATTRGVPVAGAGIGYVLFSAAMVAGRLTGDRIVAAIGGRRVLGFGGLLVAAGIAWLLLVPSTPLALAGFVVIGLGAANIAPTLFSAAGRQKAMPEALAIAATSTLGYAGVLAGPALIGFAAHAIGLPLACAALGVVVLLVPLCRRAAG